MAEHESAVTAIKYIDTGETLYNFRWEATRTNDGGKTVVTVKGNGDNAKQGAERITWTEEGQFEIGADGLRSRYWKKDSAGAEKMHWKLEYDYAAKTAHYAWSDDVTGKKENKDIALEENFIPGDVLFWLLRGYPFEQSEGYTLKGEMVMTEGNTMGGALIHRGEEKIKTPFGEIDCYKIELKPTSLILGIAAPKMYAWYTKAEPHVFLRFDGRDDGLTNPRTMNVLLEYEPKAAVK
ncbi:MAG: hypothetical protein M5R36_09390 [Deltaproteobacteria bacterium]|nr:hypothetical protein [Deltaproteobacteria bacterium]